MAKITLTIFGVVTNEGNATDPEERNDISISIGDNLVEGTISKEIPATKLPWMPVGKKKVDVNLSVDAFNFEQKMYAPDELTVKIFIDPTCVADEKERKEFFCMEKLTQMFANRKVELSFSNQVDGNEQSYTVGKDYYVHEVTPCKQPDKVYVQLKIYSPDKLLTLSQYCRSFTAKKLGGDILKSELPNYKLPYQKDENVKYDTTQMKHLLKGQQEHIIPYLVQYNESFYDLLARTTNRSGEFMYYYDGKLRIGYDGDESKAMEITDGFKSITYHNTTLAQPKQENVGPVNLEAPYDNNVLKSTVEKDGAAKVVNTIKNMADLKTGADRYWLQKVGQVLTNNKPLMNFMFDTAVDDLLAWAQADSLASQYNDKHNDDYFKKKKEYISLLDEQYDKGKKTLNQFSEADPIFTAKDYAGVLAGELLAERNTICIDYDTFAPALHVGQLIKVDDKLYIVSEMTVKSDIVNSYIVKNDMSVVAVPSKRLVFQVKAIGMNEDKKFYPMMIPAGHVRQSGPQVAVVVDADDPTKKNRVRVKYPWQLSEKSSYEKIVASDLKPEDVIDASPWLIYAASSGPAGAGVHGRHYLAEKVLVNYVNNNIERPFVVGAVSTATPGVLKTSAAVLQSPNGQYLKVVDGTGKGATAFMANFSPGLSLASGFFDYPDIFGDNEISKAFEGGVELGDKYGIWKISGSTDKRAINISSPWGNVKVSAFTGITLDAPNGNIKIRGKNVSIEAGNNLSLVSGTNIKNKFVSGYGDDYPFSMTTFMYDVGVVVTKKLASMVESMFDLSLIRSVIEVYWRPQEGALSIQSNRYLKMGAGGAMPGYPDSAYLNPKKLEERDEKLLDKQLPDTLKMGAVMAELLGKLPKIADSMIVRYKSRYNNCISKKSELEKSIYRLFDYSDATAISGLCNGYEALKPKLWDPNTKKITEADLGFTDDCASDSIEKVCAIAMLRTQDEKVKKKLNISLKNYILKRRVECKKDVVDKANALLESIRILRTEPMKVVDLVAGGVGPTKWKAPADYTKALLDAISAEKCKDTTFYKYACDQNNVITDERTSLTNAILVNVNFRKKALVRRAALNLMEGWGMESKPCKYKWENDKVVDSNVTIQPARPANEDELENEAKWNLYVRSLQFTKPVSSSPSLLDELAAAVFDPSHLGLATPIREYYSWGNAKAGQILFGTGATYSMKADGTISKLETHRNQARISRALLSEKDQEDFDRLNDTMQRTLMSLGLVEPRVADVNQVQDDAANDAANDANDANNGSDENLVV
ncbi:MAG: hypothetical protein IKD75_13020 [Prevotella sp.]|nr:hypothetical protein [Prevotella sp.]